jgi:hypothetical protein
MKLQSAEYVPAAAPASVRSGFLLLLVLVGISMAQGSRAATNSIVDCDRLETSLRSLEVPTGDLSGNDDELAATGIERPTGTAPVLLLTPRASSITREVFNALPIVVIDAQGEEVDAPKRPIADVAKTAADRSIINESATVPDAGTSAQTDGTADNSRVLHRFQKQMYRTDI